MDVLYIILLYTNIYFFGIVKILNYKSVVKIINLSLLRDGRTSFKV